MPNSQSSRSAIAVNRRHLLGGLSAAAVVSACAPRSTWSETQADVVIIGAGMAGLSAAITLEGEGLKVALLEGDSRLGGRCFTLRTNEGHFDCGATTIGPLYGRVRWLASESGTNLVTPPGRDRFSYHLNGEFVHPDDWSNSSANKLSPAEREMRPETLEFALVQQHNKIENVADWRNEKLLQYDVPLDAYLSGNGVSDEAIRLIGLTTNAMSMRRTSALFQMREFGRLAMPQKGGSSREVYATAGDEGYKYVEGGTSTLIENIAARLQNEPRLAVAVDAIDIDDDGVTVTTNRDEKIRARHVICTVPLTSLRNIKVSPAFTGAKLQAVANPHYALTTHIFCIPTDPYWEEDGAPAGLYSDDMIERVFANRNAAGDVAWLDVWINGSGAAAIDELPQAELLALVEQRLALLRPSTEGRVKAVAAYSWGRNKYVGGNKQVYEPGTISEQYQAITEPWRNRLRFAGEHTRDFEAGLEAAAESGIREAVAVLSET